MKAFIKTITVLSLTAFTLIVLGSFSLWLSAAFAMIFAADIINIVVADYQRTQRQRALHNLSSVAPRTASGLRFGA